MNRMPRVAFLPDSYMEVNGVARTSCALHAFARRRAYPFLCIYGGARPPRVHTVEADEVELGRSRVCIRLDGDLACDLLMWRHARSVLRALRVFRPDVIHITGPNDVGQLGAWAAWRLGVPLVASWQTNVHEYAARRTAHLMRALPRAARTAMSSAVERSVLRAVTAFYRIPCALMAPNAELIALLKRRTRRPVWLMPHGVDTDAFSPDKRDVADDVFRVGYVGRLSPEKNVRLLAGIEQAVRAATSRPVRFLIVGDGSERGWLARRMPSADLPGVLSGEALARAYANMDVFVFPSETDSLGLAVLEALASGTPAIVTPFGGPKTIVAAGVSGAVAAGEREFAATVLALMQDPDRHARMRRAARRRALESSWERVGDTVYELYSRALDLATRRPARPPRSCVEARPDLDDGAN